MPATLTQTLNDNEEELSITNEADTAPRHDEEQLTGSYRATDAACAGPDAACGQHCREGTRRRMVQVGDFCEALRRRGCSSSFDCRQRDHRSARNVPAEVSSAYLQSSEGGVDIR